MRREEEPECIVLQLKEWATLKNAFNKPRGKNIFSEILNMKLNINFVIEEIINKDNVKIEQKYITVCGLRNRNIHFYQILQSFLSLSDYETVLKSGRNDRFLPPVRTSNVQDVSSRIGLTNVPSTSIIATYNNFNSSNFNITFLLSDVNNVKADVIVNAANERMRHDGGIAQAISRAYGPGLGTICQRELNSRGGKINVTKNLITDCGNMKNCKILLHAVGPRQRDFSPLECCDLLNNTFFNAIVVADKKRQYNSIAIPLISSDIFGVKEEIVILAFYLCCTSLACNRTLRNINEIILFEIKETKVRKVQKIFDDYVKSPNLANIDHTALLKISQSSSRSSRANPSFSDKIKITYGANREKFVFFWKLNEPNDIFCQWYPSSFRYDDLTFRNAEQYMMYVKAENFQDTNIMQRILSAKDGAEIKALGRRVSNFIQSEWDRIKEDVIYKGNFFKFQQNPELKEALLSTLGCTLAEASPYDKVWGIGLDRNDRNATIIANWPGENLLGKVLMTVRKELNRK